jgi:hypothetical protein
MRHNKIALLLGFFSCSFCTLAKAGSITYSGAFSDATGDNVTYTITTDGLTGLLTGSDILSATTQSIGPESIAFQTLPQSAIFYTGGLFATSTTLSYQFTPLLGEVLELGTGAIGQGAVFFDSNNFGGGFGAEVVCAGAFNCGAYIPLMGTQVIATTPEPGSLATTLGGVLLLGTAAIKRRRSQRR